MMIAARQLTSTIGAAAPADPSAVDEIRHGAARDDRPELWHRERVDGHGSSRSLGAGVPS